MRLATRTASIIRINQDSWRTGETWCEWAAGNLSWIRVGLPRSDSGLRPGVFAYGAARVVPREFHGVRVGFYRLRIGVFSGGGDSVRKSRQVNAHE